jgi:hypothetical protein
MANIITAGNSTNGGTQITTDTSGTLNIVTGSGSGSNAITIDASQVVTIPNTLAVTSNQTVGGNLTVTGTVTASGGVSGSITRGTAVASTSGTSIDFTSIPSGVRRITITLVGVSSNGSSFKQLQLGTGGVPTTSGYLGNGNQNGTGVLYTTGIGLSSNAAADVLHGAFTLINHSGNTWVGTYVGGKSDAITGHFSGGSVTLSGVLNMVRLTTVNGTDAFDAGSINILYE